MIKKLLKINPKIQLNGQDEKPFVEYD